MYQLNCPHCEATHEVSAAKAGDEITCSACGESIPVPKLGELREFPTARPSHQEQASADAIGLSGGRSMVFAGLGLVCLLSVLGAAFCGVNWATIDVPMTTERHLAMLEEHYEEASSSQMIREFEDITQWGVDIPAPLEYRTIELRREAWAHKTMAFGAVAVLAFIAAIFAGRRGGRASPAS